MAGDTVITIIGNLTADPEMRFTPSGAAVASFTIASTPRTFNRQANEWQDGETLFMRCSIWRDAAENVAESLTKGTRVIAQGRLQQRSYTDREGQQRTVVEMQVDEIGPSLRYAKAQITRQSRGGGQGGFGGGALQGQGGYNNASQGNQGGYNANQGGYNGGGQQPSYNAPAGGAVDDPWATGGGTSFGDEPPF
ncbi:single-stranded DNA-binding protein [Actinomyces urogenitalis]|uniref:single-stranded DNA-binding protein n=1 Tax=Actinomyces urogenitalis TaxID=103621 RepID=UPI00242AB706|nr:single-stranded DNA-binding protein [Actinomyces urogenitalis]MCI7457584.1 single-stranded DNA-binding protein [Actinomyces urogenitalis]